MREDFSSENKDRDFSAYSPEVQKYAREAREFLRSNAVQSYLLLAQARRLHPKSPAESRIEFYDQYGGMHFKHNL